MCVSVRVRECVCVHACVHACVRAFLLLVGILFVYSATIEHNTPSLLFCLAYGVGLLWWL